MLSVTAVTNKTVSPGRTVSEHVTLLLQYRPALVPFEMLTHQFPPPPVIEAVTGSPGNTFGKYESGVPLDAES